MKHLIIAVALLLAGILPAKAEPSYPHSCIPECPFFSAWALTKVCPNLSFNEVGRHMLKHWDDGPGSESRKILREAMSGAKLRAVPAADGGFDLVPNPDACNQCDLYGADKDDADVKWDTSDLSPCRYLRPTGRPLSAVVLQDIHALHDAYYLCYQSQGPQSAEELEKACHVVDQLAAKLNTHGHCVIDHVGVGRPSKDGKHCYTVHSPFPQ